MMPSLRRNHEHADEHGSFRLRIIGKAGRQTDPSRAALGDERDAIGAHGSACCALVPYGPGEPLLSGQGRPERCWRVGECVQPESPQGKTFVGTNSPDLHAHTIASLAAAVERRSMV